MVCGTKYHETVNDDDNRNNLPQTLLNKGRQVCVCPVVRSNVLRRPDHLTMSPGASLTVNRTIYTPISAAVLVV